MEVDLTLVPYVARMHLIGVLENRLDMLRRMNDKPIDIEKTNHTRGRIAECKRFLAWLNAEATIDNEEENGPG